MQFATEPCYPFCRTIFRCCSFGVFLEITCFKHIDWTLYPTHIYTTPSTYRIKRNMYFQMGQLYELIVQKQSPLTHQAKLFICIPTRYSVRIIKNCIYSPEVNIMHFVSIFSLLSKTVYILQM